MRLLTYLRHSFANSGELSNRVQSRRVEAERLLAQLEDRDRARSARDDARKDSVRAAFPAVERGR